MKSDVQTRVEGNVIEGGAQNRIEAVRGWSGTSPEALHCAKQSCSCSSHTTQSRTIVPTRITAIGVSMSEPGAEKGQRMREDSRHEKNGVSAAFPGIQEGSTYFGILIPSTFRGPFGPKAGTVFNMSPGVNGPFDLLWAERQVPKKSSVSMEDFRDDVESFDTLDAELGRINAKFEKGQMRAFGTRNTGNCQSLLYPTFRLKPSSFAPF